MGARRLCPVGSGLPSGRIAEVMAVLTEGGLVGYPTETYYGLAASPWSRRGLERLVAAKAERRDKPIPLVLASRGALLRVAAAVPPVLDRLADRFWPGPLTIVLPARADLDERVTARSGTVGVRVPGLALARELAAVGGGAITSTSANPSGAAPPRTADEVEAYFRDLELILDGGATPGGAPSTVLDLVSTPPRLLRRGPVAEADLVEVLGGPIADPACPSTPRALGP